MMPELAEELEALKARGLFRKLRPLTPGPGAHAYWEGRELVLFCGNDYLGLSRDPRLAKRVEETVRTHGVGAGASRLISGTSDLHVRLEEELARLVKKERALVFGSGYLANLGVLTALAGERDLIVMDKLCHASLIDAARLSGARLRVFPHKNYSRAEELLKTGREFRRRILVSDTVFSMDGDLADLNSLAALKEEYGCLLVVDDAHAVGVFGKKGEGLAAARGEKIDVIVGTLSKAVGVFGGFAACSNVLRERLINFSRPFIFATAPPPILAAAALEALQLIQNESSLGARLWQNVDRVNQFLAARNFSGKNPSPIFPLIIGEENETVRISEALLERGVLIPPIRTPTVPKGKARLRLSVSAAHTQEDLDRLFEALSKVMP